MLFNAQEFTEDCYELKLSTYIRDGQLSFPSGGSVLKTDIYIQDIRGR